MKQNSPGSLTACILQSLKSEEMCSELDQALLTQNRSEVRRKDETEYWDYKEDLDVNNPVDVAKLAKWVLAFHNSKGGALFVGISNRYAAVGVPKGRICDTNQLSKKLRKFVGVHVKLFQDQIRTSNSDRPVWVIFVPKRQGDPQPSLANGPEVKQDPPIIRKGDYFVRIRDEFKRCIDPADWERLFSGTSFKHLHAYLYDIDEPYFRLLAPHCDEFIGRGKKLEEVNTALNSRHPIVALDGLGGVGKSTFHRISW